MKTAQRRRKIAFYGAVTIAIGILMGCAFYFLEIGSHRPMGWVYFWPVGFVLIGLAHIAYSMAWPRTSIWLLIAGISAILDMGIYLWFDKAFIRCSRLASYYGANEPRTVCGASFVPATILIAYVLLWISIGFAHGMRHGVSIKRKSSESSTSK